MRKAGLIILLVLLTSLIVIAHEGHEHETETSEEATTPEVSEETTTPSTAYGWEYDAESETYSNPMNQREYIQDLGRGEEYYTWYDMDKETLYVFNAETGQEVWFKDDKPVAYAQFDTEGEVESSGGITEDDMQYKIFTGEEIFAEEEIDIAEAEQGPTEEEKEEPAPEEEEKPKTDGQKVEISGLTNEAGGKGKTAEEGEEKPTTQYHYYATKDIEITDKEGKVQTIKKGQTFTTGEKLVDETGLATLSPEQKKFAETNSGKYKYDEKTGEVYTETSNYADNPGTADYKTVTRTSVGKDGTITTYQETYECEDKKCPKEPIPTSKQQTTVTPGTDPDGKKIPATKTKSIYDDKGKEQAYIKISYNIAAEDPADRNKAHQIEVRGTDKDNTLYYQYDAVTGKVTVNKIDDMPIPDEEKDKVRASIVGTGDLGFGAAFETLTFWQSLGRAVKGYYEYQGIRQLSNLFWEDNAEDVKRKQDEIKQKFCLAAGIANCITSTICENIYDLEADNIVAGRGPGGQFVSSAAINAERTPAIELSGMTRQQLIDLFGNTTVVGGRLFNLTDPAFDPKILGKIKVRLYHVQYSLRNNVGEGENLRYNILFVRVDEAYNSSYAAPLVKGFWFTGEPPVLKYLESARDDLYKFSATEYSDVCLTFKPSLPSGTGTSPRTTDKLCVPFQESITPTTAGAAPGTPPGTGTAAGPAPGAGI